MSPVSSLTTGLKKLFALWVVKYGTANLFQSCEMSTMKDVPVGI